MQCFFFHNNEITCLLKMALKSRMLNFKKIKLKKGENMIRSEKKLVYRSRMRTSTRPRPPRETCAVVVGSHRILNL